MSSGPIAPLSIPLRVTAAKRPNAAISSTIPEGTAGSTTVTSRRTPAHGFEVASGVKDDRVRDERVLVYSTDGTLPLPEPARRKTQPVARAMPPLPEDALRQAQDGTIRVAREKRRNSTVTLVHGLAATEVDAAGK